MKDGFDREINYMRISVTDRCNLRCVYCAPFEDIGCAEVLSYEEIIEIAKAAAQLGFKKFRLTGGEPLVRKNFTYLAREIAKLGKETALTTNGILLPRYAEELKSAGVSRVNISLDTLKPERYREITRGGKLSEALNGIGAAKKAGLYVKLNAVLIKNFNDDEILDFINLTYDGIEVRFLEWMPLYAPNGAQKNSNSIARDDGYMNSGAVLKAAPRLIKIKDEGVARNYKLPDAKGKVGLISAVSNHFCADCNRLRLTADGKLAPCLHSNLEIDVKGLRGEELKAAIVCAILKKPPSHGGLTRFSGSSRIMRQIGG
jgi:cyclic pyranopterin phosphate synthase